MFKNMKIAKKLIISFVLVVIISSIAGVVGLVLLKSVDTKYSNALIENGFVQGDIGNYNSYLNKGGALVRDIIVQTDAQKLQQAQADFGETKKLTGDALAAAKLNCKTPAEIEILNRIDAAAPVYQGARDRAIELGLQNKNEEALKIFNEEANPALLECAKAGEELMALNSSMGTKVSADLTSQSNFAIIVMMIVMAISAIVAIVIALLVSRSISTPVKACAERLVLLSKGDLHSPVPEATSKDETGVMLNSLKFTTDFLNMIIGEIDKNLSEMAKGNLDVETKVEFKGDFDALRVSIEKIIHSFNDTLGQINISADQVSSGSDQVSSGAQAL
ncbi:MAG: methyl-accepting chemotaxis protein, partial [Oscillospiraceae bacterium]